MALVVTPDFPPDHGGIQLLMGRVVTHFQKIAPVVVTRRALSGDRNPPPGSILRTRLARGRVSLAEMNVRSLLAGLAHHPQVVLAGHITATPAAAAVRRAFGCPIVSYLYADEVSAHPWLSRWAMRESAATIAISRYTEGLALRHGARSERLVVIPPGVDFREDGCTAAPKADQPTLVTVARLTDRYKGHDVVLEAMPKILSSVPEARWVVIGDGPLRGSLERKATSMGLAPHVRFVGALPDSERDAWLARAHVFVMPSRLPDSGAGGEGFGIVYLEAAVFGTPSIAGSAAGAPDAVVDGETGLLVDPTQPDEIADATMRLLLDDEGRRRMGAAAQERARAFAWPLISARVEELIISLLSESRHTS
jgi:phosphatidylinositol alpha-1,6-mannosyltransferase